MTDTVTSPAAGSAPTESEHLDVLVVGAGISGIGAGHYLRTSLPHKSVAILEARDAPGGTWDLFRYPGVRSDSDLYTFGYEFKPWKDRDSIASGEKILAYLHETIDEDGLAPLLRYGHRVVAADWSSADARWRVEVERTGTGERLQLTAGWLLSAGGYYRYDRGHTPDLPGRERFTGQVVHPQHWPQDLDCTGKRVVVVGSGATAMTIVPALAAAGADVTMLQRTPTYVLPVPRVDPLTELIKRLVKDEDRAFALARRKNIALARATLRFCERWPRAARRLVRRTNVRALPEGYPVDEHFNPPYDPWQQRMCVVPDGDLFAAISDGTASVVTDRIDTLTETGVQLLSGAHLEADVLVTATGFDLQLLGGISLSVDGEPVPLADAVIYRGCMLSGVPNLATAIGYTNSSWTLKVGLLWEWVCRLMQHMDERSLDTVRPETGPGMAMRPILDFGAGYVQRSLAALPKQGPAAPWLMSKVYQDDVKLLRGGSVVDEHLRFSGPEQRAAARQAPAEVAV